MAHVSTACVFRTCSAMTGSLGRLFARPPSSVATGLPTLPAIRQLNVEDATRRNTCQHRHGLSNARCTTMMDDALTMLSLEP